MGRGSLALISVIAFIAVMFTLIPSASAYDKSVSLPPIALTGVPFDAVVEGMPKGKELSLQIFVGSEKVAEFNSVADEKGHCRFGGLTIERMGVAILRFSSDGRILLEKELRVIPAWLSLLPPIFAIGLSLLTRQVLLALFVGIWVGASILCLNPITGFFRSLDNYIIAALSDPDHITILCFTLLLGGMVGIISKSGGTQGLVQILQRFARSDRSAQFITWLVGLSVFFDDYANTLFVGTTMRPLCDRFKVSREKLSYLVDTTSAPIASLAFVSTWIGFEVSLIGDAFRQVGIQSDPYLTFLASIPYRFYPLMAIVLPLWLILLRRDFGPMHAAEVRARTKGLVMAEGAVPLANYEAHDLVPNPNVVPHWSVAVLPIFAVIITIVSGLCITGYINLLNSGTVQNASGFVLLRAILSHADSYKSLLWGSALGCVVAAVIALGRKTLSIAAVSEAWLAGMRSMFLAVVILALAWGIGKVCADLQTANYIVHFLGPHLDPRWLPFLTSVISAGVSFATGSSWATMSLVMPLVIPLVHSQTVSMPTELQNFSLVTTISSVLAGSIFGDHCSPISDTTILSSLFSGSDHIDHVRTQLPYAIVAGIVAWTIGDLATAFGFPVWLALVFGSLVLAGVVWLFGKPVPKFVGERHEFCQVHAASKCDASN